MLIHTRCPLDDSDDADVEVYPASFKAERLDPGLFSARRPPDRIHYRMVRNRRTGCLRADPILDDETLVRLYGASRITYGAVQEQAAASYLHSLQRVLPLLPDRRGVLEIGCGTGFLLEKLQALGFTRVCGVEPSKEAVARATPAVRPGIVCGMLGPETFAAGAFSLVCGYQVLDHLARPNEVLGQVRDLLVSGGITHWVCHDIGAWTARLLGRACPMIDIEHTVLYDRRTVRRLFERNGFKVLDVSGMSNRYPLSYWAWLAPLPGPVKSAGLRLLDRTGLGRLLLSVNLGNLSITARKTGPEGANA